MFATDLTNPRTTAKLEMAYVLFMDIVGYSKLPMDHQEGVLQTLQEVVAAAPEFLQAEASHEFIRLPTGDGMALVFFDDAEAAARCALEISQGLKSHPEIPLRIGLHSGPVYRLADINANQNVAGGGINIAQRVMDCGDAGHILASKHVADLLCHLTSWQDCLHDLGETEVKHGVRVHLFNLLRDGVGNPDLPTKLQVQRSKAKRKTLALSIVAVSAIASVAIAVFLLPRRTHALTDKDTILLADFTNSTGDSVFDSTLRQGLSVQLEQSPFLSIISEERVQQTLKLMNQAPDARLTPGIARQVCQRLGSAAILEGSIASLGSQYVLGLKAVNCHSGDSLAEEQVTANGKEQVLPALTAAATRLRTKLGESLTTVEKFNTPIAQVTTPSLDALHAYSLGRTVMDKEDFVAAVPFFERAINLDPSFAMAYASLAVSSFSQSEKESIGAIRKAYQLRGPLSDRERFYIEAHYQDYATGDLEKARRVYELWAQTYPRDDVASYSLSSTYRNLGQYQRALIQALENLRLQPEDCGSHAILVGAHISLNNLDEARAAADEARMKKLDCFFLRFYLYQLAFLRNDSAGMARQVEGTVGSPFEDWLLSAEADTAAYSGRLRRARELSRRAIAAAERAEGKQAAAWREAAAATREALLGNAVEARQRAAVALALSAGRDVQGRAALALVLAGDAGWARVLADDLNKRFPEDTIVQFSFLPVLHALLALARSQVPKAISALQVADAYELGDTQGNIPLYPIYVRGEAYLSAHQGKEAAAEFQKILDHSGVVLNDLIGALARLQIGRAFVIEGDTAKAKAAYQDFFTLWKDADPDIPILKKAKAEYAKLQ
jgi:class 3 adenylate cyclase